MSINGIYATGVPAGHRTGKMSDNTSRKTGDFMRFAEKAAGAEDRTVGYAEKVSRRAFTEVTESTAAAGKAETDAKAGQVGAAEGTSLETMLKAKYPNLVYHVFDASSGYWRTRNDYPHYLLYQEGDKAKETLENWQPEGANPFYGSKNGKFIAPKEIHALGNVPPGSKAVVIHPKVQEKMEQDPAYAKEIMERIDTWFTFDALRNEAIVRGLPPGCPKQLRSGRTEISATRFPAARARSPSAATRWFAPTICAWRSGQNLCVIWQQNRLRRAFRNPCVPPIWRCRLRRGQSWRR